MDGKTISDILELNNMILSKIINIQRAYDIYKLHKLEIDVIDSARCKFLDGGVTNVNTSDLNFVLFVEDSLIRVLLLKAFSQQLPQKYLVLIPLDQIYDKCFLQ